MSPRVGSALAVVIALATALGCQPDSSPPQASIPPSRSGSTASPAPRPSREGSFAEPARVTPTGPTAGSAVAAGEGAGSAAIRKAGRAGKYVFLLISETDDESSRAATRLLTATVAQVADRAEWVLVKRSDPQEERLIDAYGLRSAPMPLILVLAPNGAVTSGFRAQQATEEELRKGLVSPVFASCLKAMQQRKIVLLCVQGKTTSLNAEAMKGVDAFKADARFARFTEIVRLDPADLAETRFLEQLGLVSPVIEATTLMLAPPRVLLGTFKGATDKQTFVAILAKASPGACGAGGCGPKGCN